MSARNRKKPLTEAETAYFLEIGERLRYFRKLRGYSDYEKFANKFDLPRSTYGQYERGQNITLLTLRRILVLLEVSQKEFFQVFADTSGNKNS